MFACAKGQTAAAATLLKAGASVDLVNDGRDDPPHPYPPRPASGAELILRTKAPIEAEDEYDEGHPLRRRHRRPGCVGAFGGGGGPLRTNRAGATPVRSRAPGAADAATSYETMRRREEAHAAAEREPFEDEGGARGCPGVPGVPSGRRPARGGDGGSRAPAAPEPEPEPELRLHAGGPNTRRRRNADDTRGEG